MRCFLLTCEPGLEEVVAAEVKALSGLEVRPFGDFRGKLLVDDPRLEDMQQLRSVHHITEYRHHKKWEAEPDLNEVAEWAGACGLEEMETSEGFRVSCERWGSHSFGSMDLMREAGGALWRRYQTKVDLHTFDLEVQIDVVQDETWLGIRHTQQSLSRRFKLPFKHTAPLKTTLAYSLLHFAAPQPGQVILDPFCGSGVLLLEAAALLGDQCRLIGTDMFEENVAGARENASANGLEHLMELYQADARELTATLSGPVDLIITDPPYGTRSATNVGLPTLYLKFFRSAAALVPQGGKLLMLSPKVSITNQAMGKAGHPFRAVMQRRLNLPPLFPTLFIWERN